MMKKSEALRLAELLEQIEGWHYPMGTPQELRRLHEQNEMLNARLVEAIEDMKALLAQRDELLEALKEIAADYADRFDLDSPSTNPGIKSTIKQARAAIRKSTKGII